MTASEGPSDGGGPSQGKVRGKAVATYKRGTSAYEKGRAWVDSQDEATRKGATIGWARRYRAAEGELYALLTMVVFLTGAFLSEEWAAGLSTWATWALIPVWFSAVLAVFTFLPWILLHRQITVRQLLPGALLMTLGLVGMRIISQILFVNWLVWYSSYYGGFGIVMALFFWLMIASTIIVIAAALSPALSAHREARAAARAATA
jgi:Virulence factor BrkB